ncbi:MAG: FHA domain-containing protein [Myxococcota bacterium]|nr:FHA domain-containing protein [Myxococcota bacterium]
MKHFIETAQSASLEEFRALYPAPLLVAIGGIATEGDDFLTRSMANIRLFESGEAADTFDPNTRVFPVVKRPGQNPYSKMIIIGRSAASDIYINSSEVSKMHAYFTWMDLPEGKQFQIVDGGSRNGTWLKVKKLQAHVPQPIESGQVIRLGASISLAFYSPEGLYARLHSLPH